MKLAILAYKSGFKEPKEPKEPTLKLEEESTLKLEGNQNIKIKKAKGKIEIIDILKNLVWNNALKNLYSSVIEKQHTISASKQVVQIDILGVANVCAVDTNTTTKKAKPTK